MARSSRLIPVIFITFIALAGSMSPRPLQAAGQPEAAGGPGRDHFEETGQLKVAGRLLKLILPDGGWVRIRGPRNELAGLRKMKDRTVIVRGRRQGSRDVVFESFTEASSKN